MDQTDAQQYSENRPDGENAVSAQARERYQEDATSSPQAEPITSAGKAIGEQPTSGDAECSSPTGDISLAKSYVYVLGRVEARFPTIAIEKEFAQATGRSDTAGLTDRQTLHSVLSQRQNQYLVRQICWVLTVESRDTYILHPRSGRDYELLIEALRPAPRPTDVDVVIGVRGPTAPPEMCNGLMVPIVIFDQMYSFDVDSLIKSIPRPETISEKVFGPAAEELFWKIMQLVDNAGATDEHRALNYLALRYPAIYATAAECYGRDCSLAGVEVRASRLGSRRKVVDVIFDFQSRKTDVTEKYFARVDVTEAFPFLVTKMSPFFDR